MRYLLFSICTLVTFNMYSQAVAGAPNQYESTWRLKQIIRNKLNQDENANPISYEDIKGSPYFPNKVQLGEVSVADSLYGMHLMRYNIYTDEVEIYADEEYDLSNSDKKFEAKYALLKLDNSEVAFSDVTLKYFSYLDYDNVPKSSYFLETFKGSKFSLLCKKRCVLTPAQKAASPNHPGRAAKFIIYDDYYIYNHKNNKTNKLLLKKKSLKVLFPNNADKLHSYIKKHKVKLKNKSSLIEFLTYLNKI